MADGIMLRVVLTLMLTGGLAFNSSHVAVYGVYPETKDVSSSDLEIGLLSVTRDLAAGGSVVSTHAIEGELLRTLDLRTDERIAEHARPGLFGLTSGRMRWRENATLPWHVVEYLAHVRALQALVDSNVPFGLVLQDPGTVSHAALLASAIQERAFAKIAQEAWDVLLLGWQVAPATTARGEDSRGVASIQHRLSPRASTQAVAAEASPALVSASHWQGMHAYVVTRQGAQAILLDALPLSRRFWAHVQSKAAAGSLHVSWASDGSLNVPTTRAEPEFKCHECDIEEAYTKYRLVALQVLAYTFQAVGVAALVCSLVYLALPSALRPDRGACIPSSVSQRAWLPSSPLALWLVNLLRKYLLSSLRFIFAYTLAILLHPIVRLALLGGVGYTVYEAITHPIWPVDGVAARDKLESLRLVPLTGEVGKQWEAFSAEVIHPSHGIHHAAICTLPHPSLDRLITTAGWYGDKVTVLGMNDKRFTRWGAGFGVKLELMHIFLRTVPPDDLVIFSDAFDVLMMASHADMRSMFLHTVKLAMGREGTDPAGASIQRVPSILFSAEYFSWPDYARMVDFPASDVKFEEHKFLNSGSYMGIAKDLLAVMDRFPYLVADDDQRYWTTAYLNSRADATMPRIVLDHEQDVFLCMGGYRMVDHMAFNPAVGKWKFRTSPGIPGMVHFNSGKDDVAPLFNALQSGWSPYDIRFAASFHLRVLLGLCAGIIFVTGLALGRRLNGWLAMGLWKGGNVDIDGVTVTHSKL